MKKYRIVQFENGLYAVEKLWFFALFGTGKYLDLGEPNRGLHWAKRGNCFIYCLCKNLKTIEDIFRNTPILLSKPKEIKRV